MWTPIWKNTESGWKLCKTFTAVKLNNAAIRIKRNGLFWQVAGHNTISKLKFYYKPKLMKRITFLLSKCTKPELYKYLLKIILQLSDLYNTYCLYHAFHVKGLKHMQRLLIAKKLISEKNTSPNRFLTVGWLLKMIGQIHICTAYF